MVIADKTPTVTKDHAKRTNQQRTDRLAGFGNVRALLGDKQPTNQAGDYIDDGETNGIRGDRPAIHEGTGRGEPGFKAGAQKSLTE